MIFICSRNLGKMEKRSCLIFLNLNLLKRLCCGSQRGWAKIGVPLRAEKVTGGVLLHWEGEDVGLLVPHRSAAVLEEVAGPRRDAG